MEAKKRKSKKAKLRVVGFVQSRMTSTRLSGKSLMDIEGKPETQWIIERLRRAKELDVVGLAITTQSADDPLAALGANLGAPVHRGENEHLVEQYYDIVKEYNADALVLITGDCPFVDYALVDKLVRVFRRDPEAYDFITNVLPPTWPDGLDIFLYPTRILKYFYDNIATIAYRYPVTFNFSKQVNKWRIYNLKSRVDLSPLRWTLDYQEDLDFTRAVYHELLSKKTWFRTPDILALLKQKPEIVKLNAMRADLTHGWGTHLAEGGLGKSSY